MRERGVYLSITFRNTPKWQRRKRGGEGEEEGVKVATDSNVRRAKMAGFDRCGHLMACLKTAYLEFNIPSGLGK